MPQDKINVIKKGYHCYRCGYDWVPKKPTRPFVCPNLHCHSPKWDIPRESKK